MKFFKFIFSYVILLSKHPAAQENNSRSDDVQQQLDDFGRKTMLELKKDIAK